MQFMLKTGQLESTKTDIHAESGNELTHNLII